MANELRPTSAEELQRGAHATIEEFPPFPSGLPFRARVWRPSITGMVMRGKVPNPLLAVADRALGVSPKEGDEKPADEGDQIRMFGEFVDLLAGEAFLEPKWSEVRDYLSDEQMVAVQRYLMRGPEALKSFRLRQEQPNQAGSSSEGIQPEAEPGSGDPGPVDGMVSGRGCDVRGGPGGEGTPGGDPGDEEQRSVEPE